MRIEACFYLYYYTNTNTKILSINVSDAIDFSTSHTHASKKLFSRVFHVTRPPQTQKFFRNIPKCRSFGATATATATATKGPLTLHGTPAFFFLKKKKKKKKKKKIFLFFSIFDCFVSFSSSLAPKFSRSTQVSGLYASISRVMSFLTPRKQVW
ncbi:hypothetical protein FIM1_3593 [Kluyveromyces marxianus]|uniref:Uncharacterized protein n=1 Tax=Kluyveromyces marxianus TaxID=4911 RepID=A0ABX6F0H8_KLUMA|nr:hypothetical protein FIM1_3593 [Kluyveromyces marxianus]